MWASNNLAQQSEFLSDTDFGLLPLYSYCLAPFHRRPDLRIPDRWETLLNPGILEWWWAVYAPGTRRNIFRRHSLVSTAYICTLLI